MTILVFILVLFVLVLVHEFGHFVVAKKTGMRVDEFGIGFPPRLFGIRKGDTEYTLNLLPLGGFVKIYGEDADADHSLDGDRSFTSKGKWAQAFTLIAGVGMNVLFAWLLFAIAFSVGVQTAVEEADASENAKLIVAGVVTNSPAMQAGIPEGAIIESVRLGEEMLINVTPSTFQEYSANSEGESLMVTYRYGETELETSVTPTLNLIPDDPNRYAVGVALSMIDVVSRPIHIAIYEGLITTLVTLKNITVGISTLIWDALNLQADFSDVAGPVGIVGLVGQASAFGLTSLIMFTAFISLNLAIINLLPFPALDGGRLLFVIVESIKGSPLNGKYVQLLDTIGFALLILLMLAVTWNDISRIL